VSAVGINYVGVALLAGTGFFLTPYMLHVLGRSRFGILLLATAIFSYGSLLDFGLGISVMKLIADRSDDDDPTHARKIISTVMPVYAAIGVAIVVVGIAASPFVAGAFHVRPAEHQIFEDCYWISMIGVGLTFPLSVFTAVITGHRDFLLQNRFVIAYALCTALGTVIVLALGYGVVAVAAIDFVISVGQFAIKMLVVGRKYGVVFSPRYAERAILRQLLGFAGWIFVINVAAMLIFETDLVVVGALLGPAAVAAYQVALSPNTVLRQFGEQFNVVALTGASALQARRQGAAIKRLFLGSTHAATVLMLPFVIVVAAWGSDFIRLWVGSRFRGSDTALVCLTIAMVEVGVQGTAAQIIVAHSKHKIIAIATACEAVANLALSIVLGTQFGITGVAVGTVIPTTVTAFVVALPYASRITGTRARELAAGIGLPALEAIAIVGVLRALRPALAFHSMPLLLAASAALFLAFVGVNLLVLSGERATYRSMVRGRVWGLR
jgi:O-antigen/teichoic acid export membrane protein